MSYTEQEHADELALAQKVLETFLSTVGKRKPNGDVVLQTSLPDGRTIELRHSSNGTIFRNPLTFAMITIGTGKECMDAVTIQYEGKTKKVSDSSLFRDGVYMNQGHIQWWHDMDTSGVEALIALLPTIKNWTIVQRENSMFFQPRER